MPEMSVDSYSAAMESNDPEKLEVAIKYLLTRGLNGATELVERLSGKLVALAFRAETDDELSMRIGLDIATLISVAGDRSVRSLIAEAVGGESPERSMDALLILMAVKNDYINGQPRASNVSEECRAEVRDMGRRLAKHEDEIVSILAKELAEEE